MAATTDEFKIAKLEKNNYYGWSIRVKAALVNKNLWPAIDPGYGEGELTPEQQLADQKALAFLHLAVDDNHLDDIGESPSAREAWQTLEDLHTKVGLFHTILKIKEMVTFTKTDDMTMQAYLSGIQELNRSIKKSGVNFADQALACFYLLGLPMSQYEGLIRSLEKDEDALTTSNVKARLLVEEKRIQHDQTQSMSLRTTTSTHAQQKSDWKRKGEDKSQGSFKKRKRVICFTCGEAGHISRHCENVHKSKSREEHSRSRSQSSYHRENSRSRSRRSNRVDSIKEVKALCVQSQPQTTLNDSWILDSGCTDHMTGRKEFFEKIEKCTGTVTMANGDKVQIYGIGHCNLRLTVDQSNSPKSCILHQVPLRRSSRERKITKFPCCNLANCHNPIPKTYQEAMEGEEAAEWREATEEEIEYLRSHQVFELVKRPPGKKIIGAKWVLARKTDADGRIVKYKARLVAQGHTQILGVDYMETFCPVIKRKTIRIMIALALENGWDDEHIDVKAAYINSTLDEEVYMEQAPGFEITNENSRDYVYKIKKSIFNTLFSFMITKL